MQAVDELAFDEAVELYWKLLEAEGREIIDQPGRDASYRVDDGWRMRNIRGDLAYVLDTDELGDLRDLEPDDE